MTSSAAAVRSRNSSTVSFKSGINRGKCVFGAKAGLFVGSRLAYTGAFTTKALRGTMRLLKIFAVLAFACAMAVAQNTAGTQPSNSTTPAAATKPGVDINALDKSVDPCVDFYKFACDNWQKSNPIPADKARYGRLDELAERNGAVLRGILEVVAKKPNRTPVEQRVGDYYGACMDTSTIENLGTKPLLPLLDKVAAMKDKASH